MRRFTTPKPFAVPMWEGQPAFKRADLVFDGVEHAGDSFVGRIFLAADADDSTPTTIDKGYAGSLYVFGHGRCFGDPGHCKVPSGPIHPFDYRRPHMLTPQVHVVQITKALRAGRLRVRRHGDPDNGDRAGRGRRALADRRLAGHLRLIPAGGPDRSDR